ncbi:MAG: transposase, partial [Cyclobacteriaceae bacterium]
MSEKYKFRDLNGIYFITLTIVGWVDLFTRSELKNVIIDSLKYCQQQKGLVIHAWCIMPSHLHLIVASKGESLSNITRDFKKFTAKKIISEINKIHESRKSWLLELFGEVGLGLKRVKNYKVWQDGNHPILLTDSAMIDRTLEYIHNNPVKDQIVDE